jgi:eukaryotic-like serine/threonine-protein kinase
MWRALRRTNRVATVTMTYNRHAMMLGSGTRLGVYEITASLGSGGMGEVYRARDTRLGREVAIKILPAALARDPERLVRLEREAKALAALNHPHIAQIYGVEERIIEPPPVADVAAPPAPRLPSLALVMELVEGDDLAARLARGALPVDEAIAIARQIADGLEAAHERGIIHRDLKPANVRLTRGGIVKILDFGLAKALDGEADPASSLSLAQSPTISRRMTEAGLILGTAAYMAPEQARGVAVDRRADIWAFGVVFHELLTGRRLFGGDTVSDVLAAVLRQDVELAGLPAGTPAAVRRLLARCLDRDPKKRLRDIGEARVLLSEPLDTSPSHTTSRRPARWPFAAVVACVAALAGAGLAVVATRGGAPEPTRAPTLRVTVAGPVSTADAFYSVDPYDAPVVSPDARTIALPLETPTGKALYLRPLNGFEAVPVEGGGRRPFFSPDGRAVAFMRGSTVWLMDLAERAPELVGRLPENLWDIGFPAWHPDGRLLIPGSQGLWAMPATGGEPTLLVPADQAQRELFTAVKVLPDRRLVVNVAASSREDPQTVTRVEVVSSDGRERRVVASGLQVGTTLLGDVLVTRQAGQWRATRFDLQTLQTVGASVPLSAVPADLPIGESLAWIDGASLQRELVWVTRAGVATPLNVPPGYLRWPRLSPDGTRVAFGQARGNTAATSLDTQVRVHVVDLRTGGRAALEGYSEPVWTPDGQRVITSLGERPLGGLGEQIGDGSRRMARLFTVRGDAWPTCISRDGTWLVYYGTDPDSREGADDLSDIFLLNLPTEERRRVVIAGLQRGGRLSPDERWLAFQSQANLMDRVDIHVRPFPALDADYVVSTDGGDEPAWSPDGRELYFRRGMDMMAVQVPAPGGAWPPPRVLFTGAYARDTFNDQSYDVAPDGRFLLMRPLGNPRIDVQVVLNWLDEVRSRLAAAR